MTPEVMRRNEAVFFILKTANQTPSLPGYKKKRTWKTCPISPNIKLEVFERSFDSKNKEIREKNVFKNLS